MNSKKPQQVTTSYNKEKQRDRSRSLERKLSEASGDQKTRRLRRHGVTLKPIYKSEQKQFSEVRFFTPKKH